MHPIRIESALLDVPKCDAISARALAELSLLLDYAAQWMENDGECRAFLHKGRDYQGEINKALGRWDFDLVKHQSVVEPDSVVLEISKLRRRNSQ